MKEENFRSSLAPYIIKFIKHQLKKGRVYRHGEVLLHKFDVFCTEYAFTGSGLTKELVVHWRESNRTLRPRVRS